MVSACWVKELRSCRLPLEKRLPVVLQLLNYAVQRQHGCDARADRGSDEDSMWQRLLRGSLGVQQGSPDVA